MPGNNIDSIYYDMLKHGDNLFVTRTGLLLVGEAFLLQAISGMATDTTTEDRTGIVMALAGTTLTVIWLIVAFRYVCFTRSYLRGRLIEENGAVGEYFKESRKPANRWSSPNLLVGIGTPLCILTIWAAVLMRLLS